MDFDFFYDAFGSNNAMQAVGIEVLYFAGNIVASAAHNDPWVSAMGQETASLGDRDYATSFGSEATRNFHSVDISRTGDLLAIHWPGWVGTKTGSNDAPVRTARLKFAL